MSAHPREPFDAEEARIKRAYDALPHGEPSAALDVRVLANARGAVAANRVPKRRRPWFLGAGLGTAAAAVFAAGIAWQLGVFEGDRNLSTVPSVAPAAEEEVDRIDIEFMKQEHKKDEDREQAEFGAAPPPPPPAPRAPPAPAMPPPSGAMQDAAGRSNQTLERRREAEKPQPQAAESVPEAMAEPQAFPSEVPPLLDAAPVVAAPAETGTAAPARESEVMAGRDARDRADAPLGAVAGARQEAPAAAASGASNRAGLAKEVALPPWAEDVKLAPDAWLERIRDRVQRGDRQDAEHSLRRFVLEHPRQRVPRDLQRLLVE